LLCFRDSSAGKSIADKHENLKLMVTDFSL